MKRSVLFHNLFGSFQNEPKLAGEDADTHAVTPLVDSHRFQRILDSILFTITATLSKQQPVFISIIFCFCNNQFAESQLCSL